mgnify:CR=1 FL=1
MKPITFIKTGSWKLFSVIIIFLFLFNVTFVIYPFSLLNTIETPETNLKITIYELNSTSACINSSFFMDNPNDFSINLKNMKIDTILPNGQSIGQLNIFEQQLPPKKEIEFHENFNVCFHGQNPQLLHTEVTGEIEASIGLFKTNLPLTISVDTDMKNIINDVQVPVIHSNIKVDELNKNNVAISLQLDSYNPNSFDMDITNISVTITTDNGNKMGMVTTNDAFLSAKSYKTVNGSGTILLNTLNAEYLLVNISMDTKVIIAGFIKESPLQITSKVDLPDLDTLLSTSFPTDVIIQGDYHPSLHGLIDDITFIVRNPNNVEYTLKDIQVNIYRIDNDKKTLIGNGTIEPGLIQANSSTSLSGEVLIPYRKILIPPLGTRILPDWLEVSIRANATIKGLQNYMWVGMIAYQDFNPLRKDTNTLNHTDIWYK